MNRRIFHFCRLEDLKYENSSSLQTDLDIQPSLTDSRYLFTNVL